MFFDDSATSFLKIQSILNPGEDINKTVIKYLVLDYVKNRESYDPMEMNEDYLLEKFRRVHGFSSSKVFDEYKRTHSTSNYNSPFIQYGDRITRKVTDVTAFFKGRSEEEVVVHFTTREKGHEQKEEAKKWIAKVKIYMPSIYKKTKEQNRKLDFIITEYEVESVEQ